MVAAQSPSGALERLALRIVADLSGVGVDEALPVGLLAVVAAGQPEAAGPVAAVRELGAGAHLVAVRVEDRAEIRVPHVRDRVEAHPGVGDDARGARSARSRRHATGDQRRDEHQ